MKLRPLSQVAKVALHFDRANAFNNSIGAVMRYSYDHGGVGALYAGWAPTVAKKAIWAGGYFGSLGLFQKNARAALRAVRELAGSSSEETLNQIRVAQFVSGFAAGTVAAMLNIPADNVRTVIQRHRFVDKIEAASRAASKQHLKTLSVLGASRQIWRARGIAGFYAGYPVKVTRTPRRGRRPPRASGPRGD